MDLEEARFRRAELMLAQLRHQTVLRHSDLQRRFLFGLTLSGGLFLSLLRAEVPSWSAAIALLPLGWALAEARKLEALVSADVHDARTILLALSPPKGSGAREDDGA